MWPFPFMSSLFPSIEDSKYLYEDLPDESKKLIPKSVHQPYKPSNKTKRKNKKR